MADDNILPMRAPRARPTPDIDSMRLAIATSKTAKVVEMDPDTQEFMGALERVILWIEHLETPKH